MGECRRKVYLTNTIVTHSPIVCFGGFGEMPCQYLRECLIDNQNSLSPKMLRILSKLVKEDGR